MCGVCVFVCVLIRVVIVSVVCQYSVNGHRRFEPRAVHNTIAAPPPPHDGRPAATAKMHAAPAVVVVGCSGNPHPPHDPDRLEGGGLQWRTRDDEKRLSDNDDDQYGDDPHD